MQGKYKVITLCGSTRFKDAFIEAQKKTDLRGEHCYKCRAVWSFWG